ncbi:MAG: hypothetical protein V9E82_03965 [Candidatus Nanopelagicales bacterium]
MGDRPDWVMAAITYAVSTLAYVQVADQHMVRRSLLLAGGPGVVALAAFPVLARAQAGGRLGVTVALRPRPSRSHEPDGPAMLAFITDARRGVHHAGVVDDTIIAGDSKTGAVNAF